MDDLEIYEALEDLYDDDVFCGDAARSAIVNIIIDGKGGDTDEQIKMYVWRYVEEVVVQSIRDYINRKMEQIITDIREFAEEYEKE